MGWATNLGVILGILENGVETAIMGNIGMIGCILASKLQSSRFATPVFRTDWVGVAVVGSLPGFNAPDRTDPQVHRESWLEIETYP